MEMYRSCYHYHSSVDNLDGMLRAAKLKLDDEKMRRLDEIFDINRGRPLKQGEVPEAWAW